MNRFAVKNQLEKVANQKINFEITAKTYFRDEKKLMPTLLQIRHIFQGAQ